MASRSLAANTAVGRSAAGNTTSSTAAAPTVGVEAGGGDGEQLARPVRRAGEFGPNRRSRTCCRSPGPSDQGDVGVALVERCSTASRPPSTSSTDTEHRSALVARPVQDDDRDTPSAQLSHRSLRPQIGASSTPPTRCCSNSCRWARSRSVAARCCRPARSNRARCTKSSAPEHQVGEERVGDVHHHHADGPAAAGAELPRGLVGHPAELGDGRLHALPGLVADQTR